MTAGTYYVRVFNKDTTGKYALAIGKQEKFTFLSLIRAFFRARSLDIFQGYGGFSPIDINLSAEGDEYRHFLSPLTGETEWG